MKFNCLAIALSSVGFCLAAHAADPATAAPEPKVEKITVTGSNIKRISRETASPVMIITNEQMKRGGATTLTEVLRNISVNVGGIDENRTSGFTAGASGLNLRGLGSQATLMLINGRRLAAYAQPEFQTTFVDLNTLPMGAVDRIEVLKDGASAIYGSEAMAGVVNIILKESYEGLEIGASYGESEVGDGETARATASFGYGNLTEQHFNAFATLDIRQQKPSFLKNRGGYIGTQDLRAYGYSDQRNLYTAPGNIYWTDKATGKFNARPIDGKACPADQQVDAADFFGASGMPGGKVCVFDDLKDADFNSGGKSDRFSLTSVFNWQPNADTKVWAEVMRTQNKARVTGQLHWVAMQLGQEIGALPITHPQYPQELIGPDGKTLAGGNGTVRLRSQLKNLPAQGQQNTTDFGRYLVGAKGVLGNWDWETAILTNSSEVESRATGGLLNSKFIEAVQTGKFLFGDVAGNAALYPSLVTNSASHYKSSMSLWDAKASGELLELPAGPLSMAVGVEARRESLETNPDPNAVAGELYHSAELPPPMSNSRNIRSIYSELNIPILSNLEAQLAARHDRYSDYGKSTTPKLGLKWTPWSSLVLRSTYAEGFRAPTLVENSTAISNAFISFQDPARCNARFKEGCNAQSPYQSGSNPNLGPEKGESFTYGFVWEPNQSFNMSVDFWRIKRKNEISTYDLTTVLANEALFANNPATVIVRDPLTAADATNGATKGEITLVKLLLTNVSVTDVKGVDMDLRGRFNLGAYGKIEPSLNLQYVQSYRSAPTPNDPMLQYIGTSGQPRLQGSLGVGWKQGPWSLSADARYVGKMGAVGSPNETCRFIAEGYEELCRDIASFTTVNIGGSYRGFKNVILSGAVKNAFDRKPPFFPYTNGRNYYAPLHDSMGRYFQASAVYTFY